MKNLGITDNIYKILRESGRHPMSPAEISRRISVPGWDAHKLRRNVASIMINELIPGRTGRWKRVDKGKYVACRVGEAWIKVGIKIQHQKTGAILVITGKPKRNGHETTLDKWSVRSPTANLQWVLKGEDISRDWVQV